MNIFFRASLSGIGLLMLLTVTGCQQKTPEKVIGSTLKSLGVKEDAAVQYVVLPKQVRFVPGKGMGDAEPQKVAEGVVILIDSGVQEDWGNRFQLLHVKEGQNKIMCFIVAALLPISCLKTQKAMHLMSGHSTVARPMLHRTREMQQLNSSPLFAHFCLLKSSLFRYEMPVG